MKKNKTANSPIELPEIKSNWWDKLFTQQPYQKPFKRCILHIGTEKTGTSTIQRFLTNNRRRFIKDGVLYPKLTGDNGGSQWGFIACFHPEIWKIDVGVFLGINSPEEQEAYQQAFIKELTAEYFRASEPDTLVISCEHFHSKLNNIDLISRLKTLLEPWVDEFEVVVYFRRQDRVAVSHYSTIIKSGANRNNVLPAVAAPHIPYYYNYSEIYKNWADVFGTTAIKLQIFHPSSWLNGNLIEDFCNLTGLKLEGKKQLEFMENVSVNRVGTQFLRALNKTTPNVVDGKRNEDRDALAGFVSELCQGKDMLITKEQAMSFMTHFAETNRRLQEMCFPSLETSIFDDDYSEYPETLDSSEPKYEEAVSLAFEIWKAMKK